MCEETVEILSEKFAFLLALHSAFGREKFALLPPVDGRSPEDAVGGLGVENSCLVCETNLTTSEFILLEQHAQRALLEHHYEVCTVCLGKTTRPRGWCVLGQSRRGGHFG